MVCDTKVYHSPYENTARFSFHTQIHPILYDYNMLANVNVSLNGESSSQISNSPSNSKFPFNCELNHPYFTALRTAENYSDYEKKDKIGSYLPAGNVFQCTCDSKMITCSWN